MEALTPYPQPNPIVLNKILKLLFAVAVVSSALPFAHSAPPYSGTIFLDPDIITSSDPSAYQSMRYDGTGSRYAYDRRSGWGYQNYYLYTVSFSDGRTSEFQVNREFGSESTARSKALKYAQPIGRIPKILRADVDTVTIHAGNNPFGGGSRNLLIHDIQGDNYISSGILEETFAHEATHTSIDPHYTYNSAWQSAQDSDREFISTYARDNPDREDLAESLLPYLAYRFRSDRISRDYYGTIERVMPNRIAFFDTLGISMVGSGGGSAELAKMTSPAPSSTLSSTSVTFQWTKPAGATEYDLVISNQNGTYGDILASSPLTSNSRKVDNLPSDGRMINVALWTKLNGQWQSNSYSYTTTKAAISNTNYVKNGGFESGMANWSSGFDTSADFHQTYNRYEGSYNLAHWKNRSPYEVMTYQSVSGLANGTYKATVFVKSTGGQNVCSFYVYGYNASNWNETKVVDIAATSSYRKIEIANIQVTNGQCTIAVYSKAANGSWAAFDNFELVRQ